MGEFDQVQGIAGRQHGEHGRVTLDETRIRRTNLKVSGFVERIFVGFVGKKVRRGDPLFVVWARTDR